MAQSDKGSLHNIADYQQQPTRRSLNDGLNSGGGGGTFDPMEPRVAALEKSFDRIEKKLDGLVTDVAEMKGQLKAMPTAIQLLLAVVAIFTASGMLRYFGH
ncbi:hypothetical protein ONR75_15705 [Rhodopseudomonas sp. P2A-2r]|uniref:hypothetical protein n=1 Tax=Rhodopseudomonas sp. P2A-2r TaxID=2991972 RepID=UPI002233F9F0|nr:hypothetical protein [Rhodopseudomonas sp. P2A-2r]UZE51878.1 hypothetical protein ONR75_15705 [Rhodopseudomonas sp. P2A-2r]